MSMDTQCVKCKDVNSESGFFVFDVEGRLVIPAFGCELYEPLQATWQFMNGSPYHKISDTDLAVVVEEEKRTERIMKKKAAEEFWDRSEESARTGKPLEDDEPTEPAPVAPIPAAPTAI